MSGLRANFGWKSIRKFIPELPEQHYLEAHHISHLAESGISPSAALVAGIFSADAALARTLTGHGRAGLIFTYFTIDGKDVYRWGDDNRPFFRLRPDNPPSPKCTYLSPKGAPPRIYFPRVANKVDFTKLSGINLALTEGEKKSLLATLCNIPCIGIGGVYSYKTGDKDEWGNRALGCLVDEIDVRAAQNLTIVFDSDITHKYQVARAIKALAGNLIEAYHQLEIDETCSNERVPTRTLALAKKLKYALLPTRLKLANEKKTKKLGLDDAIVLLGESPVKELLRHALPLVKCKWEDKSLDTECLFAAEPLGDDAHKDTPINKQHHVRGLISWLSLHGIYANIPDYSKRQYCPEGIWKDVGEEAWKLLSEQIADAQYWLNRKRAIAAQELRFVENKTRLSKDQFDQPHLLGFINGVLELNKKKLIPHSPKNYITQTLGFSYDPEAQCIQWLTWLNWLFEDDEKWPEIIQALIRWTITPKKQGPYPIHIWPVLIGPAGLGKGTFLSVLTQLIGEGSYAAWNYHNVNDARGMNGMSGKRACFAMDLKGELSSQAVGNINSICVNEPLDVEAKYKDKRTEEFKTVLWAAMNQPIKSRAADQEGLSRRVLYIPFSRKPTEIDTELANKLKAELPGIFNWAWAISLDEAVEVLKTHLKSEENIALQQRHLAESNTVYEWMEHLELSVAQTQIISVWYNRYKEWVIDTGCKPLKMRNWKKYILAAGAETQRKTGEGIPLTLPPLKDVDIRKMLGLFN